MSVLETATTAEIVTGLYWRPIETAPKDGSEILLFNSLGNRHIGRWGARYLGDPKHDGWTWDGKQIGGYITHWMPLPPKPTLKD